MSNSSQQNDNCMSSVEGQYSFMAWFLVYVLFLPVFLFILYIGFNKWKNRRSSPAGTISHSDVFTFNIVTMEMISLLGSAVACFGIFIPYNPALNIGGNMISTTTASQMLFHSLTCVERYLAVVHPVTYMRLKTGGGVNIRNTSIAFVWILSIASMLIFCLVKNVFLRYVVFGFLIIAPLPLIVFCSVSVLCVLIRPKPGDRKQIGQSKRATFYTMTGILGALLMRLVMDVSIFSMSFSDWFKPYLCVILMSSFWSTLPCSLVLPLLFLHRARKLPGGK